MKKFLLVAAIALSFLACKKEYVKSANSASVSNSTTVIKDDFSFLSPTLPSGRGSFITTGVLRTLYTDTTFNTFGGHFTHVDVYFDNPDITYTNLTFYVDNVQMFAGNAVNSHFVFNQATLNSLNYINPGYNVIKVTGIVNGSAGSAFHTTIQVGGITWKNVSGITDQVTGLPSVTAPFFL